MTRILFLIPTLMHGGAEKVLVNLVNNLNHDKFKITVYAIFDGGVNKEFLNSDIDYKSKFRKVFRGNSQLMKLFTPEFLFRFFVKEEYDIIVSFLEGPAARIVSGCKSFDIKKIAWIHSDTLSRSMASVGFRNFAEARDVYRKYDRIIGVSENVVKSFVKIVQPEIPVQILYNVNESEQIRQRASENVSYHFQDNETHICSVGKVTLNKGFDRLLEVHQRLLSEGLQHQIHILGIGEDQSALEKRIKKLGMERTFNLHGFHKNPYKYISKCDIYVCASHREGFSTAVTEALILGVPVVSTEVSGARELLGENNEYGIVTENSTDGLFAGLKMLLTNPEKLLFYKKQAQIRGNFFSKETTVKHVENFFESLINE